MIAPVAAQTVRSAGSISMLGGALPIAEYASWQEQKALKQREHGAHANGDQAKR
jgi:hypothetical protein